LHTAPVGLSFGYQEGDLPVTEQLSERLVRLPFYYDLSEQDQLDVVNHIKQYVWQTLGGRKAA
jgi:dTDP-4-amino-4,6-dideoxygalactose transaminase